jgi:hypothetical protein
MRLARLMAAEVLTAVAWFAGWKSSPDDGQFVGAAEGDMAAGVERDVEAAEVGERLGVAVAMSLLGGGYWRWGRSTGVTGSNA